MVEHSPQILASKEKARTTKRHWRESTAWEVSEEANACSVTISNNDAAFNRKTLTLPCLDVVGAAGFSGVGRSELLHAFPLDCFDGTVTRKIGSIVPGTLLVSVKGQDGSLSIDSDVASCFLLPLFRSRVCEPVWPSGKGARLVSRRTSVRSASAFLSLQITWFMDTVL